MSKKALNILLICILNIYANISFSQENTLDNPNHFDIKINNEEEEINNKINIKKIFINTDISVLLGITQFYGDIKEFDITPTYEKDIPFFELQSAIEIALTKKLSHLFSARTSLIFGKFAGINRDEAGNDYIYEPYNGFYEGNGEYFLTKFTEADFQILLNISNASSFFTKNKLRNLTIFFKGGGGINIYNTLNRNLETGTYIYGYGYEEDGAYLQSDNFNPKKIRSQPKESVYSYGLLSKYEINNNLSLILDVTRRKANTDLWDSHDNQSNNDKFNFYSLGLSFNIGRQIEKENWVTPLEGLEENIERNNVSLEWLSEDSDNDGVADAFDKETNTPIGVAVDGSGVSLDVDMDNIPDYLDADPFSTKRAIVDINGVEFDSDRDGIPDSKDLENNTLIGSIVNQYGITINNIEKSYSEIYIPSIYFESGSYFINNFNSKRIATIAIILKNHPEIKLEIIGHADKNGDRDYNQKLSQKRAESVAEYLSSNFGLESSRFVITSKGEDDPLKITSGSIEFSNNNSLEINRRVDFRIVEKFIE